jgi:alpha-1,3-mannosyltransferase
MAMAPVGAAKPAPREPTKPLWHLARVEPFVNRSFPAIIALLVAADLMLAAVVISRTSYTEVDWRAYMQEVRGVLEDGEWDYRLLRGDTGPLVYPAGFVYIFAALFYATDRGANIVRAQIIFALLHAAVFATVACIYRMYYVDRRRGPSAAAATAFPVFASAILLLASRRIMSLFVLRLFNDSVQVLFMYISLACFARNRWSLGCFMYSISVSVKMNALLYAPALSVLLCQALGPLSAAAHIVFICGGVQLALGGPFLLAAPLSYITKAFEFSRVFFYKWSVNGAFLPENVFLDKRLSRLLLAFHLLILLAFGFTRWTDKHGLFGLVGLPEASRTRPSSLAARELNSDSAQKISWWSWAVSYQPRELRAGHVVHTMLSCNLAGIAFARTLHYQFYLWYFHSLPLLTFSTGLPSALSFLILCVIEVAFNVFPPQGVTALALCVSHFIILIALWRTPSLQSFDIYAECMKKTTQQAKVS